MIHLLSLITQETQMVKQVSFLDWDSDEERERSQRGVRFRQTLRLRKRNRKRAKAMERQQKEQVWSALIDAQNQGPLGDRVRDEPNGFFWWSLQHFFGSFRRSPLWQPRGEPQERYRVGDMLAIFRDSSATFDDIRQHDSVELPLLAALSGMRYSLVRWGFLTNPVASTDSSASDTSSSEPSSEDSDG